MQGSSTLMDLHLLVRIYKLKILGIHLLFQRLASEHFDKGGARQVIRISAENWIAGDPPCEDTSPHILAVLVDK